MSLFEELQELMIKYRFRPEKKLSQFFCMEESLLDKMVEEGKVSEKDTVLEIGPGTGFLTRRLLDAGAKVVAVERDKKMVEVISGEVKKEIDSGKLRLLETDFLDEDIDALGANKTVSLPPYHLSSEIIAKLSKSSLESAVLMLDTGFVSKITAFEGLKEYTALSAFLNLNAELELVRDNIPGDSFFPTPNTCNAIVRLFFHPKNNSEKFYHFLKELFRHKKKDLSRSLKQAQPFLEKDLGLTKERLSEALETLDLADVKVNLLTPEQFLEVYETLLPVSQE